MLSGAIDADPVLLQRIASKTADPDRVQRAIRLSGGTPVHRLREHDERMARLAKAIGREG